MRLPPSPTRTTQAVLVGVAVADARRQEWVVDAALARMTKRSPTRPCTPWTLMFVVGLQPPDSPDRHVWSTT